MERLTTYVDGEAQVLGIGHKVAFARLAAYENTGLEPEEICVKMEIGVQQAISLDAYRDAAPLHQAQQWAKAHKEGRLVVLQNAMGTRLYEIIKIFGERCIREVIISETDSLAEIKRLHNRIEKTVFLTREEAEAAMRANP